MAVFGALELSYSCIMPTTARRVRSQERAFERQKTSMTGWLFSTHGIELGQWRRMHKTSSSQCWDFGSTMPVNKVLGCNKPLKVPKPLTMRILKIEICRLSDMSWLKPRVLLGKWTH